MATCETCGQDVIVGYLTVGQKKDGQPRRETVLLEPHRQTFAPYEDGDVDQEQGVRLFYSNARAEHVCQRQAPAKKQRKEKAKEAA